MVGLVGVEARVQVRARAGRERVQSEEAPEKLRALFKRCSREPSHVLEREFCDWRVVLNSPTWPCPRATCRIRLSVWGGAPPMPRLAGVEFKFCDISSTFEIDKLTDLYTCIIMQGAQI